jgi:protein-disulfide isomerase
MTKRRQVFEVVSTLVVVACAVAAVGMQAYRLTASERAQHSPSQIEDWREQSASGIWLGRADAELVVTTFVDFTCAYCRALAPVLDSLRLEQGDRLAIVFHHYPLGRVLSMPSAIAGECACRQGRFGEVAQVLYDEVAAPGPRPPDWAPDWAAIAARGGVSYVAEFLECIELPEDSFPRIGKGKEVGRRAGVRGTPTVWVNGTPTDVRDFAGFQALWEGRR